MGDYDFFICYYRGIIIFIIFVVVIIVIVIIIIYRVWGGTHETTTNRW